jgi:signal transduction histidine kinase
MVEKFFKKIYASAQRMSELIRAVLNYSKLGKGEGPIANVDLNAVLKNVIDDFELNIEEKHATILSEPLPSILGNELQISQVFSNLIGNALKFSRNNPEIKISGTVVDKSQMTDTTKFTEKKYLEIVFADNGIGFEPQYEKKIFSLFERLHAMHEYSGTGIGLALCKRIMENHGGTISALSEPGKGARFYVYFPIYN